MGADSKIEWTDHTWNPWIGCTRVSPGCDNCYAATQDKFRGWTPEGWGGPRRRTSEANWREPLKWNRNAEREGRRFRVFCASLADVFDNEVPPDWRADLLHLIVDTPHLDWLLLTKRIGNAHAMLNEAAARNCMPRWGDRMFNNIWIGSTVVNQEEADRDIPKLLDLPARVRFLSIEPMLGPVDLRFHFFSEPTGRWRTHGGKRQMELRKPDDGGIHWVICGGESGPGARPMHPDWARSIRNQCAEAGVPFHFKQWGEWLPGQNEPHPYATESDGSTRRVAHHQDGRWGETDTKVNASNYVTWDASGSLHRGSLINAPLTHCVAAWAERVGKKAAGRLLDGVQHDGFPE